MHFTCDGGYLHEHTGNCHTFKHIYLLPLVHRPKGVLLVLVHYRYSATIFLKEVASASPLPFSESASSGGAE